MTNLSAKTLEIKLKNGATTEELASYYDCTPEYLELSIRQKLSEKAASSYLKRIAKNDRIAKKLSRFKTSVEEPSAEEVVEEVLSDETTVEESSIEESPELVLDTLKAELVDLKDYLNEKELKHRDIEAERHSIRCELQTHKESLSKILEQVELEEEAITSLQKRISETSEKMIKLNGEINSIREEIEITEGKIHELESVSVLVFDSGVLETSVAVPEDWAEIFAGLVENESLGDFKANQLRGLAKAKALKDAHPELTFEFVFETEALESFL